MTHVAATRFGAPAARRAARSASAHRAGPYYNRSDIERPVEWWESKGYRVKLTDGVWAQDDYVAGTPQRRADDLNALFADPEVDVIQVLWGGTGAMQVLPFLDYDLIAANPKALMGYSDITNLHIALRQQQRPRDAARARASARWASPTARRSPGTRRWPAFTTGGVGEVPRDPDDPYVRTIAPGTVTAPIVGGNLFTFVHLMGTPWDPVFDGAILFFEEVHEPAYVIEVHLDQLRLAGKLDGIAGVVVGRDEGLRLDRGDDRRRPAQPFTGGCAGAASSATGGAGAIQAPSWTREAPRQHPPGGHRDPRRRGPDA